MLANERKHTRQLEDTASEQTKPSAVRQFRLPCLNFKAKEYYGLTDRQNAEWSEQPLTRDLAGEELQKLLNNAF